VPTFIPQNVVEFLVILLVTMLSRSTFTSLRSNKPAISSLTLSQASVPPCSIQSDATDALFIPLLDRELKKIVAFYEHQEQELMEELQDLEKDVELQDELGLRGEETWGRYADDDDEEDDDSLSRSPARVRRRSLSHQRKRSSSHRAPSMSMFSYDYILSHTPL
jgi:hypothetical protein